MQAPNPIANPVQLSLDAPLTVARWRPLVHWLLAIPQVVVLYVVLLVAEIMWIVAFFSILFTRRIPESVSSFIVMAHRYQWRVTSYLMWMREPYPPFTFDMVSQDPGDDPARLSIQPAPELNRWLPLVKWLLVIPQYFVLFFLGIALYVVWAISFFAVLITGKWPEGMREFAIGVVRWSMRVNVYAYLLTDVYPPFSLE
jgi:hypothetical protein